AGAGGSGAPGYRGPAGRGATPADHAGEHRPRRSRGQRRAEGLEVEPPLGDRRREPATAVAAVQVGAQLAPAEAPAVAVGDRLADVLTFHGAPLLAVAQRG